MAALLHGQGVNETADKFKLDKSVVSRWKRKLPEDFLEKVAENHADRFGLLLTKALETNLETMAAIAKHAQDPKWLMEQSAAELGTFVGILSDKTMRMFEAAETARTSDEASV